MGASVAELIGHLRDNQPALALGSLTTIPEDSKSDDLKLIELVARLKADPNSPMVEHYLNESIGWSFQDADLLFSERAFLKLLQGEASAAASILRSTASERLGPLDYNRLGNAELLNGNFSEALHCYDEAIALDPDNPDHHNNKGGALARLQRFDEAIEAYERCLQLNPQHPTATTAKNQLLIRQNQSDEVLEELEQSLDDDEENVEKRLAYFNALVAFNRYNDAGKVIQERLKPVKELRTIPVDADPADFTQEREQLQLRAALIDLLETRQMYGRALNQLNQQLSLFETEPTDMRCRKVHFLAELRQFDEAFALIEELSEVIQDSDRLDILRASVLSEQGKEEEALAIYDNIEKSSRFYRQILNKKADIKLTLGRIEDSHADLLELLDSNIMVAVQLINSKNYKPDDEVISKLKLIARNPFTPEQQKENICFALALACDKRKEFTDAAEFLKEANDLVRKKVKYQPQQFTNRANRHIKWFASAQGPQIANPLPEDQPKPIFIVGMPRSGTTLTETIMGSHSLVSACGELGSIPKISRLIKKNYPKLKPYPECIDQLGPRQLAGMAQAYVNQLPEEGVGAIYTADKLPHNFMNVGLIHRIFPQAPIIHVMRDPRDNGLSNYQQNFGAKYGGMGFAFDLEHLANEINNYWRLMKHWRAIGVPMIEFWYEDLVNEQEAVSRALVQFCGLEWEEGVLEFHKLERRVKTASVGQVRNKMYKSSAQKWRSYEELLQPLIQSLDTSVVEFYEPS